MDFYVTIDRGNTALKAALWSVDGSPVRKSVRFDSTAAAALAQSLVPCGGRIVAVAYCTVVSSARTGDLASLEAICRRVLDLTATVALPLQLCYGTPQTLGADRIAAAAGALTYACGRPVLVADIGTAVTYDFVDAGGRYLGGNIAPGISMRLSALHAHTSALPAIDVRGPAPMWGNTTEEALRSGTLRGVAAELEYWRRAAGDSAITVLTGGSVPILEQAVTLDFDYIHDPYLVLRGLYSILRYNEN